MGMKVEIIDSDNARMNLKAFNKELPDNIEREISNMLVRIGQVMQNYPPPLKYKRTYLFQRSWVLSKLSKMRFQLQNAATQKGTTYPSLVVGDDEGKGQVRIHKGRWPLVRKVTDTELIQTSARIDRRLNLLITAKKLS